MKKEKVSFFFLFFLKKNFLSKKSDNDDGAVAEACNDRSDDVAGDGAVVNKINKTTDPPKK